MRPQEAIEQRIAGLEDRTSAALDERTLRDVFQAMDPSIQTRPDRPWRDFGRAIIRSRITKLAIAAAIIAAMLLLARYLVGTQTPSNQPDRPQMVDQHPLPSSNDADQPLAKELALAEQRFNNKDVAGLMDLLETGLDQTQVKVAGYLAELDAHQAVPALQRLAAAWTGDPNANPFAQTIARIKPASLEPNHPPIGQAPAKTPASPVGRGLKIKVVDKVTGLPLPGTQVEDGRYVCDANGCCQVDVQDATSWEVWVLKPGYVGTSIDFQLITDDVLSQTHLFALDPGTVIGGIVQDVNGMPIEGAIIRIFLRPEHDGTTKPLVHVFFEQRTDATGRWSCDTMPADLLNWATAGAFDFGLGHPDYVPAWGGAVTDISAIKAMMDQIYSTTLYEGSTLRGRVISEKGRPIGDARVNGAPTGPDGTFVVRHIDPNTTKIGLTIDAEGYPRTVQQIDYRPDMVDVDVDVEIVLQPGWFLSGRVVDTEGKPLADAIIDVINMGWGPFHWHTNADGRYITGPLRVPVGIMNVGASKAGFIRIFRIVERPVDGPMDFVLYRELHVSGQVLDAQTGRPLDRFRIRTCSVDADGRIRWEPGNDLQAYHYKHTFYNFCETGYKIVVTEANGHLPAESRIIAPNERDPVIDFALTRGTGPTGTVVDLNGLPVAEAWVYAIPENEQAGYNGSGPMTSGNPDTTPFLPKNPSVNSGTDGRFSFEPIYQLCYFVALAEQGLCSETVSEFEQSGHLLVIQPWAEVGGTMHTAIGSPVKDQPIEIKSLPEAPARFGYKWSLSTNTDDQGAFQIKRVPPGGFTLLGKTYQVAAGQVLILDLTVDPTSSGTSQ